MNKQKGFEQQIIESSNFPFFSTDYFLKSRHYEFA
jgi:hypothetical protein